jgi:hypothetical protein
MEIPDGCEASDSIHLTEEEDMPWTQTARDRRVLADELRENLEVCRRELEQAADQHREAAQRRFAAALQAFNQLVDGSGYEPKSRI